MTARERRLEIDEVGGHDQCRIERFAFEHAVRLGLERQHGVPRLGRAKPVKPFTGVREEHVDQRRIVGAIAAVTGGLDRAIGREDAGDRFHVLAQVHDAHRQRDRLALHMVGMAVTVPALEGAAQGILDADGKAERLHEHHRHFAAGGEVVDDPFIRRLLEPAHGFCLLLRCLAGRGERDDVAHDLRRVCGVVNQRLAANRDLVAEHGGDFVCVTGAADVAQQRHPVDGLTHVGFESRAFADPRREQAGAELRFERLAECVVLRQGERGDEFTEAEGGAQNGEFSRCFGGPESRYFLARDETRRLQATPAGSAG